MPTHKYCTASECSREVVRANCVELMFAFWTRPCWSVSTGADEDIWYYTNLEVLAQHITEGVRLHVPRLSSLFDLKTMLVSAGDKMHGSFRMSEASIACKYIRDDHRVEVADMWDLHREGGSAGRSMLCQTCIP